MTKISFVEHKKITCDDLKYLINVLENLIEEVQNGDMEAFERFWIEGGTEEGDARIFAIREQLILRYFYRKENE